MYCHCLFIFYAEYIMRNAGLDELKVGIKIARTKTEIYRKPRDKIANTRWIMKKARQFQKNIYFCFIDCAKVFECGDHNKMWEIL